MRRLLYIPIIHSEADLGSTGSGLARQSAALSGEERWAIHQETVSKFWESVAAYLRSLDSRRLSVYQDGLPADGETGRRIVEQAAARGSQNYQLVLEMLNSGAELRKTENPVLLLREYENIHSSGEGQRDTEQYRSQRDRLLEERDAFIAETIGATLKEGELGVLFMGAFHNVTPRLAADISVEMVKDPEMVQAYVDSLFGDHDDERLEKLGQYLAGPVLTGRADGGSDNC